MSDIYKLIIKYMLNSINKFKKFKFITKALIILGSILIIIYISNLNNINNTFRIENFENNDMSNNLLSDTSNNISNNISNNLTNKKKYKYNFLYLKDLDSYKNNFYCQYYDSVFLNQTKNNYETKYILNISKQFNDNNILDVGSGTGNHVSLLSKIHKNTTGLDISEKMIEVSKKNYPNCNFKQGDILNNNIFDFNSFTIITCLGLTIYDIIDKEKFFDNCNSLLQNNGLLIIHIIDRDLFNPFVPPDDNTVLFNPLEYDRKRIFKTIIKLGDLEFSSDYKKTDIIDNNNSPNIPYSIYSEKFQNFKTNKVVKIDRNLYMPPTKYINDLAKSKNFTFEKKIDLNSINYNNEYLYIYKKK